VGTVADVLHHGQDVLAIDPVAAAGPRAEQILIPFVKAIVPEVDIAGGVLVIDPPEGLLNLHDVT
jgi:16S rRNA processing protein RimM